jgi:2-aminoethylphosphonate-pyruvate transaminase
MPAAAFKGPPGQEDMPYLLTPGPLTTSRTVKHAMLADWGSRDIEFRHLVGDIRQRLLRLAGAMDGYECVLMQGSGTFAIEAALGSFTPTGEEDGTTLVVINGAYGTRCAKILDRLGRPNVTLDVGDSRAPTPEELAEAIEADEAIGTVIVVHCETTSGIVNPLPELAAAVKSRGKRLIVDAMSSFGAIPLDMAEMDIDVMVSSSNKCIEGVPGFGYVICRRDLLEGSRGRSHSIALDLYDQWQAMEGNGQFRFTPPTHALAAFHQALMEHAAEGGVKARGQRYWTNRDVLVAAMRDLGFRTLLSDEPPARSSRRSSPRRTPTSSSSPSTRPCACAASPSIPASSPSRTRFASAPSARSTRPSCATPWPPSATSSPKWASPAAPRRGDPHLSLPCHCRARPGNP